MKWKFTFSRYINLTLALCSLFDLNDYHVPGVNTLLVIDSSCHFSLYKLLTVSWGQVHHLTRRTVCPFGQFVFERSGCSVGSVFITGLCCQLLGYECGLFARVSVLRMDEGSSGQMGWSDFSSSLSERVWRAVEPPRVKENCVWQAEIHNRGLNDTDGGLLMGVWWECPSTPLVVVIRMSSSGWAPKQTPCLLLLIRFVGFIQTSLLWTSTVL